MYINRYLQQDYGEGVRVEYIDVDSPEIDDYPALREAVDQRRPLPLVLAGDQVKSPPVLSFSWIVNELKELGVVS